MRNSDFFFFNLVPSRRISSYVPLTHTQMFLLDSVKTQGSNIILTSTCYMSETEKVKIYFCPTLWSFDYVKFALILTKDCFHGMCISI